MPDIGDVEDPCDREAMGMQYGSQMPSPYSIRWDKRDDYIAHDDDNQGWIGEDNSGIWIARHPLVAMAEHPRIWGVVSEWQSGIRDISLGYWDSRSAYDVDAMNTMAGAYARSRKSNPSMPGVDDG